MLESQTWCSEIQDFTLFRHQPPIIGYYNYVPTLFFYVNLFRGKDIKYIIRYTYINYY